MLLTSAPRYLAMRLKNGSIKLLFFLHPCSKGAWKGAVVVYLSDSKNEVHTC